MTHDQRVAPQAKTQIVRRRLWGERNAKLGSLTLVQVAAGI